jgi:hypothetical protein
MLFTVIYALPTPLLTQDPSLDHPARDPYHISVDNTIGIAINPIALPPAPAPPAA